MLSKGRVVTRSINSRKKKEKHGRQMGKEREGGGDMEVGLLSMFHNTWEHSRFYFPVPFLFFSS